MLIMKNWQVIHEIVDPNAGNVQKSFMMPFPDFDAENFPFMLCSGQEAYTILDIKQGIFYPFIKGSALNSRVQQPAFFTKEEDGIKCHFNTKRLDQSNKYENDYSVLHLRQDFIDVLKTYQRPCFPTVRSALDAWKDAGGMEKVPSDLTEEEAKRQIEMAKKEAEAYKRVAGDSKQKAAEAKKEVEAKQKALSDLQKKNEADKKAVEKLRQEAE